MESEMDRHGLPTHSTSLNIHELNNCHHVILTLPHHPQIPGLSTEQHAAGGGRDFPSGYTMLPYESKRLEGVVVRHKVWNWICMWSSFMQPLVLCERKHNEASLTATMAAVFSFHVSFEQFILLTPEGKQRYKGHRGVQHLLCADEGTADVSCISQHGGRAVNISALLWIKREAGLCSSQSGLLIKYRSLLFMSSSFKWPRFLLKWCSQEESIRPHVMAAGCIFYSLRYHTNQ